MYGALGSGSHRLSDFSTTFSHILLQPPGLRRLPARFHPMVFIHGVTSAWNVLPPDIGMSYPHLLQVWSNVFDSMRPSLTSLFTIVSPKPSTHYCCFMLYFSLYHSSPSGCNTLLYFLLYFVYCLPPPLECGSVRFGLCCVPKL